MTAREELTGTEMSLCNAEEVRWKQTTKQEKKCATGARTKIVTAAFLFSKAFMLNIYRNIDR